MSSGCNALAALYFVQQLTRAQAVLEAVRCRTASRPRQRAPKLLFTLVAKNLFSHVFFLAEYWYTSSLFGRWKWPELISVQCQSRHF